MKNQSLSRREVIRYSIAFPVAAGGFISITACDDEQKLVCYDSEQLGQDAAGLRISLKYKVKSPFSDKSCGTCAFFEAKNESQCGHCQILNGPVNAAGHCESWSEQSDT